MIAKHQGSHSVRRVCAAFGWSRSSHHVANKRKAQAEAKPSKPTDDQVVAQIVAIKKERFKDSYGGPRLTEELRETHDMLVNHKRVARLITEHGLQVKRRKKKVNTTDSGHSLAVADNVLKRDFRVGKGKTRWVSDITYLHTPNGFVYMATIIDVATRRWLGYAVDSHMRTSLIEDALRMATQQTAERPALFHSDRGSQYASEVFRAAATKLNAQLSMSRKGNCHDNAVAESFFATFKREVADTFASLRDAQSEVFNYFLFYNNQRRHSALDYLSPNQYYQRLKSNNIKHAA